MMARFTPGALSTLRMRDFRYLWLGSVAGQLAYWVQLVAYGWLAYELTASAAFVGLVAAATAVPALIVTLPGGVIADRWNRRRLLVWSQVLLFGAALVIAILVLSGTILPWQLAAGGALSGLFSALNLPARQSLFPRLLPAELVGDAIALFGLSFNLSRVIGPALAGLLMGSSIGGCFVFLAACVGLGVVGLALIGPEPAREAQSPRSLLQDFPDTVGFAWRHTAVRWLLGVAAFQNAFGLLSIQLLPVFAGAVLDVGAAGLGALMSATGVGATAGAVAAAILAGIRRKGDLLLGSSVVLGAAIVALAASTEMTPALLAAAAAGAAISLTMTMNQTVLTLATPDPLRGRIWSIHMMTWQLPLLAALPGGWIADQVGVGWTIGVGGALVVLLTAVSAFSARPVREFGREATARV